jgi:hypothetical protein
MKVFPIFVATLIVLGCQSNVTNPELTDDHRKSGIELQIDLIGGFAGNFARVDLNEEQQFYAQLSESSPFVGPEASFTIKTFQKQNSIAVYWGCVEQPECVIFQDSHEVVLGDSKKYFIGLQVTGDSISVLVRDEPFLYL